MIDFKKIPISGTLNSSDMEEVKPYLIPAKFKKKEVIFSEGDPSDWLYVVTKGKVKITKLSQSGREIILEIILPMDFFGGVAVMRGFPYPANAVAMDDAELLKISRSNLMRILDRFPNLMYCMAMNIGDRIKGSHEALKNIAVEKVESRIASMLIKLADKAGSEPLGDGSITIDMKLTKQDIAEMVGTTVETSIRTMSKFKKLGIVSEKGGKITIKDINKLKALCG
ncbi:MAG: Crp/Fnr family transcriptional regulator [Thermodesulfovibrionales bacterium]|nr:Crp/Fnr family transcriptional regulator [Thermodesulfovibrionales bacterium]